VVIDFSKSLGFGICQISVSFSSSLSFESLVVLLKGEIYLLAFP